MSRTLGSYKRKAYIDLTSPRAMKQPRRAPVASTLAYRSGAQETKYFDTSFSQTVSVSGDWTGTEVPCTNYIQSDGTTVGAYTDSALIPSAVGPGYGQIVGSKYSIKKIRVRGEVSPAVAADQADLQNAKACRIVLVLDTQPNGAQAQGEEVFSDLGDTAQVNYSFLSMAAGSGGRFRILADDLFLLQPASAGTDGTNTNSIVSQGHMFSFEKVFKKPLQVRVKANASTPTVAALSDNNIFLLAHMTSGVTAIIRGAARCYYVD